jgi:hypothetical protein
VVQPLTQPSRLSGASLSLTSLTELTGSGTPARERYRGWYPGGSGTSAPGVVPPPREWYLRPGSGTSAPGVVPPPREWYRERYPGSGTVPGVVPPPREWYLRPGNGTSAPGVVPPPREWYFGPTDRVRSASSIGEFDRRVRSARVW